MNEQASGLLHLLVSDQSDGTFSFMSSLPLHSSLLPLHSPPPFPIFEKIKIHKTLLTVLTQSQNRTHGYVS